MKIDASFVSAESSRPEWRKECALPPNSFPLLMLELSQDESFVVGTFMTGFQLWNSTEDNRQVHPTHFATLMKKSLVEVVASKFLLEMQHATDHRGCHKLSLFPHAQNPLVNAPQIMRFLRTNSCRICCVNLSQVHDTEAAVGDPQHRDQDEQVQFVRAQRRPRLRCRRHYYVKRINWGSDAECPFHVRRDTKRAEHLVHVVGGPRQVPSRALRPHHRHTGMDD